MHRRLQLRSTLVTGLLMFASPLAADIHWSGFLQVTGEVLGRPHEDGFEWGADRARVSVDWSHERFFAKLQLDLNVDKPHESPDAGLPNIAKHAFVGYHLTDQLALRAGQSKAPIGMDFNRAGSDLDITKRGLEKGLVFEFVPGITLVGQDFGPFGFDVGVYRIASRSTAVATDPEPNVDGDALAWAGRLRLDTHENLHWEASWGKSGEAGGRGTRDYRVWDVGGWWQHDRWTLRSELIRGKNLRGVANTSERVGYVHIGYAVQPKIELVTRHYRGQHRAARVETDLANTYVGVNLRSRPDSQHNRLQINYVFSGGDEAGYGGLRREYIDDALLMQWQLQFK